MYISIDGVLRNLIEKFEYHYVDYYLDTDTEEADNFNYMVNYPLSNELDNNFTFQSKEEFNNFLYIDFALEIFGHAKCSYSQVFLDLNNLIFSSPDLNITLIGMDEMGKSKSSTLFFLAKNGFNGNNIKFIKSTNIKDEWKNCDIWITDNEKIIGNCPSNKKAIKFNTNYNKNLNNKLTINNLTEIKELCLKFSENIISSIWMQLVNLVKRVMK